MDKDKKIYMFGACIDNYTNMFSNIYYADNKDLQLKLCETNSIIY